MLDYLDRFGWIEKLVQIINVSEHQHIAGVQKYGFASKVCKVRNQKPLINKCVCAVPLPTIKRCDGHWLFGALNQALAENVKTYALSWVIACKNSDHACITLIKVDAPSMSVTWQTVPPIHVSLKSCWFSFKPFLP